MLGRLLVALAFVFQLGPAMHAQPDAGLRPPAVPLVTHDPYLSIWSRADRLTDVTPTHWTHRPQSLASLIRVDGKPYRLMGAEPADTPAMAQQSLNVTATRSTYEFQGGGVRVTLAFLAPNLPDDLDTFSWPLTYLTWTVASIDGASHHVELYDSTSSQLAVNTQDEAVEWKRVTAGNLTVLKVGTHDQPVLLSMGDDHRIDWGYACAAADSAEAAPAIGAADALEHAFVESGKLPSAEDTRMPRPVSDAEPVLAFAFDLGAVGGTPVTRQVIVAYDEIYAIRYFEENLRPFWNRNGRGIEDLLQTASSTYPEVSSRCAAFDAALDKDLNRAGGSHYAQIAELAYRQVVAACGLAADANGQPLFFTKENTSNGDIATVDVLFPMDPVWLLLSPTLAKASAVSNLMYAASPHWKFPNAPHDLGTYPMVFGRDDGGEQMPVEESGNLLILCDAIAHADGNAGFVAPWWPQLSQWAHFLEQYGLDPENQLCTDDFMGHLAHNANLSIKAILGLAAYGDLCRMRGDRQNAEKYLRLARQDAAHWAQAANDGDHSRLAFDKPGTWSTKYNLVWDQILGLKVFPPQVAGKEIAFYLRQMESFGMPLDSRTKLGDTDHMFFTATMAGTEAQFDQFIDPFYVYLNGTPRREPLTDTYETTNIDSSGMESRPVVGGIFIKMLSDPDTWKKWASRDKFRAGPWAPLPVPPKVTGIVLAAADTQPADWHYTTTRPAAGWETPGFDDGAWKVGKSGFGTAGTPASVIGTVWNTDDIWLRRHFTLARPAGPDLRLWIHHDEDVEVYFNGVPAAKEASYLRKYKVMQIRPGALAALKVGDNVIALHGRQTEGGQYQDAGLVTVTERP
jgi:hypothetical protein